MAEPQKIFVYGSCVSRDTLEFLPPQSFQLVGYLARHSLLSHGTDASEKLPADLVVSSDFQARMIRKDWEGDKLDDLINMAEDIDLLIWDLIDERHGVHWFPSGEVITRSIDLLESQPAQSLLLPDTHISFGSDIHFEGWAEKAREFVTLLSTHGLLEKTRLIRVGWAEKSIDASPVPSSMGITPQDANVRYLRYYDLLEELGVPIVRVPPEITLADTSHRWGSAPFHYSLGVYEYLCEELGLLKPMKSNQA